MGKFRKTIMKNDGKTLLNDVRENCNGMRVSQNFSNENLFKHNVSLCARD